MTEHSKTIAALVNEQLSADLPDYASISISLGLFESAYTAKQSSEAIASAKVPSLFRGKAVR